MTNRGATILKLWRKQKGVCYLCGAMMCLRLHQPHTATIDHVVPKSSTYGVCLPKKAACFSCNQKKGAKSLEEYRNGQV